MDVPFEDILWGILNTNNDIRRQAEAHYEMLKQSNFSMVLTELVTVLQSCQHIELRSMSVVLLRGLMTRIAHLQSEDAHDGSIVTPWDNQPEEVKQYVQSKLLESLSSEQIGHVRRKICDAIAAVVSIGGTDWPGLLEGLFHLLHDEGPDNSVENQEIGLILVDKLAVLSGDILENINEDLPQILGKHLSNGPIGVRAAALRAVASYILAIEDNQRPNLQDFVAQSIMTIGVILANGEEQIARECMESIALIAEYFPQMFKPILHSHLIPAVMQVIRADVESATKSSAIEIVISIAESAGGMIRKNQELSSTLVDICLQWMCEAEEDEDWTKKPYHSYEGGGADEDEEMALLGEVCFDRFSRALGGRAVLPCAFSLLPEMIQSEAWQQRRAAVMAIALLGDGSKKQIREQLSNLLQAILPLLDDPHPRVRFTVIHCLGQMAADLGIPPEPTVAEMQKIQQNIENGEHEPDPEDALSWNPMVQFNFQHQHHTVVLPALISVIKSDNPSCQIERLAAHAAHAIINFCHPEQCSSRILEPHMDELLSVLFGLLNSGTYRIQEQAITAVACSAQVLGQKFTAYYSIFMPILKEILVDAIGSEFRLLRAKAMECAALVGNAVGKEIFAQDAKAIMDLILETQSSGLSPDDPQVTYVMHSCARICQALGDQFLPYMPIVLPPLIYAARADCDFVVMDSEECALLSDEMEGMDIVEQEGRSYGIKTAALEEKCNALHMIFQYIRDLKEKFLPFVTEVVPIVLENVTFRWMPEIRTVSANLLPRLLHCYIVGLSSQGLSMDPAFELFQASHEVLLRSLSEEHSSEIVQGIAEAYGEMLRVCHEKGKLADPPVHINQEQAYRLLQTILECLEKVLQRRREREKHAEELGEDYDEEEFMKNEEEGETDDDLVTNLVDIISYVAKILKNDFFLLFENILQKFAEQISCHDSHPQVRSIAVCIYDDLIENCSLDLVLPYLDTAANCIITSINSEDPPLRQAAVYGVGVLAEKSGDNFQSIGEQALQLLLEVITAPDSRALDNGPPTDNAISSVSKIIKFQPQICDLSQMIPLWLSWLPLTADRLEAQVVHRQLLEWIEENNPYLLCLNNIPRILNILFTILSDQPRGEDEPLIHENNFQKAFQITQALISSYSDEAIQVFEGLDALQKRRLNDQFGFGQ